jgi:excisionase family DNA binding protein
MSADTTTSAPVSLESLAGKLDALTAIAKRADARFLSVKHAADYCSVSPDSIRCLLSSGKLRALRPVKGRIVIDRAELDALVLGSDQRPRKGRGIR